MTTIFEQLDGVATGSVTLEVDGQIGKLATIGTTVAGLVENPPSGIEDLLRSVQTLPLPDLSLGGDLPGTLSSLGSVVPTDLSTVTGDLTTAIASLAGTVGADLSAAIAAGLTPILELRRLLEIDASCLSGDGDGGAGGSGGPAPPPPPPPDPAAPAPPPAAARAAGAVAQAKAALDQVPETFTTLALLQLIAGGLEIGSRDVVASRPIPILDDLRDGLATLLEWNASGPAAILASLAGTLTALAAFVDDSVDAAFGTLAADAGAVATDLGAASLATLGPDLVTSLEALRSAAAAGDLATTAPHVQAIDSRLDALGLSVAGLTAAAPAGLPALGARLQALPGELDDQVAHVVALLAPPISLPIDPGPDPILALDDGVVESIEATISPVIGWLQDIAAKLDISAIEAPVRAAAAAATGAVDDIEQAIASVTTQTQHLFGEVERQLDALDTAAIAAQLESALGAFQSAVVTQLTALFAPVRSLLGGAIGQIDAAVTAFDPGQITALLEDVTEGLGNVLDDPAIVAARDQVGAAFAGAEQAIASLSFSPVTDAVVGTIDEITAILEALEPSLLSAPLQLALQGAVAILPGDLEPITDPLLDDMQVAVDAGPGALVAQVRAPLAQLQDKVRRFEPAALVGDALSGPFQDAVGQLEAFKPSRLLEPVDAELGQVKGRLRQEISPARLLEPLQAPFDALLAAFDQLDPVDLVAPIESALSDVIDTILDALPIDELLEAIGQVLDAVAGVAELGHQAIALLERGGTLLDVLGDAPADVQAFADGVLDKLAGIDAASLQGDLDALASAIGATSSAALAARAAAALDPLTDALGTIAPGDQLAAIAVAQRAAARALEPLPDTPQRSAALAAVTRADATAPALAAPLGALAAFARSAAGARTALARELATWDARYHGADATLPAIAALQATPQSLTAWVRGAVQPQVVVPLRAALAPAGPIRAILGPLVHQLQALMTVLDAKLAVLGTGPGSAGEIKAAIDELLARLRGLDLAFLRESLDALFAGVRAKIVAIGPEALGAQLDAVFDAVLATLDVGQVLPQADIDQLDADVVTLAGKLKLLDPGKLVVDVVQPIFEQDVLPLIDAFDLTGVLDALLATLHGLRDELDAELDRVNASYQAMLAAVPPFDPLSIEIDIDVDVPDVGGLF